MKCEECSGLPTGHKGICSKSGDARRQLNVKKSCAARGRRRKADHRSTSRKTKTTARHHNRCRLRETEGTEKKSSVKGIEAKSGIQKALGKIVRRRERLASSHRGGGGENADFSTHKPMGKGRDDLIKLLRRERGMIARKYLSFRMEGKSTR